MDGDAPIHELRLSHSSGSVSAAIHRQRRHYQRSCISVTYDQVVNSDSYTDWV